MPTVPTKPTPTTGGDRHTPAHSTSDPHCPVCSDTRETAAVYDPPGRRDPCFLSLELYGLDLPCTLAELEARLAELKAVWPQAVEYFMFDEREARHLIAWFEGCISKALAGREARAEQQRAQLEAEALEGMRKPSNGCRPCLPEGQPC